MRVAAELWAIRQWEQLVATASGLGHILGETEQDTPVSLVAECQRCTLLFAVDGQERPYQFSNGLSGPCAGVATV